MKRRPAKGNGQDPPDTARAAVDPDPPATEEKGLADTGAPASGTAAPAVSEIEALQRERDDLRDRLLRRTAEFDNYRKRTERERQQAGLDSVTALLKALVPTLDNLDRALSASGPSASLREGVELTRRELLSELESRGLVVEDPKGQPFDPARHQALSHEHVPGFVDGQVVEVLRRGYSFQDRLLRPALVKVAKAAPETEGDPEKVH